MTTDKYESLHSIATRRRIKSTGEYLTGYRLFRQLKGTYFIRENVNLKLYPVSADNRINFDFQLLARARVQ